ncbi:MAG: hypothetical protein EB127_25790 [Alphaproteobacteria bacterium]|nr:hypothetical protein [Alphaproteobacteria bacterium]
MPRVKRLFKPSIDNPHDVFNYGRECGKEEEQERILELLKPLACNCDENCNIVEIPFHVLKKLIRGEDDADISAV